MRKNFIPALILLFLSVLIAVGSVSFLGPCVHEDGSFGTCHWAGQAMLGIGLLLSLQSLVALLCRDNRIRIGLYLSSLMTAVLGFFTPGTLISLCRMSTMRCRSVMRPAMLILCGFCAIFSILCIVQERGKKSTSR